MEIFLELRKSVSFFLLQVLPIEVVNSIQFIQIKLEYNTNNNKDPGSELVEDHNHKKLKMKKREKKKKRENMGN